MPLWRSPGQALEVSDAIRQLGTFPADDFTHPDDLLEHRPVLLVDDLHPAVDDRAVGGEAVDAILAGPGL